MGREGDWQEEKQGLRKEDKATVKPRRTSTRQGGDSGRGVTVKLVNCHRNLYLHNILGRNYMFQKHKIA